MFLSFLQPFDIDNEYCGKYDFNTPINGPKSIKAQRAISIDTTASSLIVTTTYAGYTVAFIGTRTGHIKKVRHKFWEQGHSANYIPSSTLDALMIRNVFTRHVTKINNDLE